MRCILGVPLGLASLPRLTEEGSINLNLNPPIRVCRYNSFETLSSTPSQSVKLNNRVRSIAFSPDGCYLASGSDDNTVKLWNLTTATGHCQQTTEGHNDRVRSVAFSPDGRQLASASIDTTVKLWDLATGQCRKTPEDPSDWVRSVSFSPGGSQLASSSDSDNTIKLWDFRTCQYQQTLVGSAACKTYLTGRPRKQVRGLVSRRIYYYVMASGLRITLKTYYGYLQSIVQHAIR